MDVAASDVQVEKTSETRRGYRKRIAYISGASSACTKTILAENNFQLKFRQQPRQFYLGWGNPKSVNFYRRMPASAIYFQIPGSGIFGRKDALARLLRGKDIHPLTYVLPAQAEYARQLVSKSICLYKPAYNARGNGIRLLLRGEKFNAYNAAVVQRYCQSLLLGGYKFDLRVYVLVTAVDPLCVYIYKEGLARFATVKHERLAQHCSDRCMFLTNYAVNRMTKPRDSDAQAPNAFHTQKDAEISDVDFKWTLSRLFEHLDQNPGVFEQQLAQKPSAFIWEQINAITKQVFLAAEEHLVTQGIIAGTARAIPRRVAALYGADFIILRNGKVQILEVNVCPSSGTSTQIDREIKFPMHNTMFAMTGAFDQHRAPIKPVLSQQNASNINFALISDYERALLQYLECERTNCGAFTRILPSETQQQRRYLSRLVLEHERYMLYNMQYQK